LPADMLI